MPATPQFILEDGQWWTTTAVFPSWKGFQSRHGDYGAQDNSVSSDGTVRILFAPEGRGNEPLTDAEVASVVWVLENEAAISKAVLSSIVKEYPRLKEDYDFPEDMGDLMPDIESADELRSRIGLHTVHVHQLQKDGIPYIGFEFGCTWDEEHGLGVLMHGTRTVEVGLADTAILLWIAERHAEASEQE
jgi:hypothetical protein